MKSNIEELRKKYMDNPPEGMTSKDIRNMSEDELLDMDFFLNEDDLFADEAGVTALAGHRAAILFNGNLYFHSLYLWLFHLRNPHNKRMDESKSVRSQFHTLHFYYKYPEHCI